MINKILGWVGIIGIFATLFILTAMSWGFVTALVNWGGGITIGCLLAGCVMLVIGDNNE